MSKPVLVGQITGDRRRDQAERVKAQLAEWLAPRGLAFNEDKTRIVHLNEGFDFLGATRGRTA